MSPVFGVRAQLVCAGPGVDNLVWGRLTRLVDIGVTWVHGVPWSVKS